MKLKRLELTEALRAHVGLVREAEVVLPGSRWIDVEKVDLANAVLQAIDEQEAALAARVHAIRPRQLPTPVVEVELRRKRSRRA